MASKSITASKESTFHGVIHNKSRGALILSETGLLFRPETNGGSTTNELKLTWSQIAKHQVSPATHPKHLMKLLLVNSATSSDANESTSKGTSSHTFQFLTRNGLESARREVSTRLSKLRLVNNSDNNIIGKKRPRDDSTQYTTQSNNITQQQLMRQSSSPPSTNYITHDPIALIATRSSLLASDPALRAQHRLLVVQNSTLTEEDFWETHSRLVADEYARISGCRSEGMSSNMKSCLDLGSSTSKKQDATNGGGGIRGVIHLGVEEIRQIFLMYPSVHKAYEEKVPLELSEEQFWRKYLESEYFHRDRGRAGIHVEKMNEVERREMEKLVGKKYVPKAEESGGDGKEKKKEKVDVVGDEARLAAAAGTDDIFSRYDSNVTKESQHLGTKLASGQFDLASTAETERGERYLEGSDLFPSHLMGRDSRGARVIDKYNRHWAIVLHPKDAVGDGSSGKNSLASLVNHENASVEKDDVDKEMSDLVGFANANENCADHSRGLGEEDGDTLELTLHNVGGYSGKFSGDTNAEGKAASNSESELAMKYTKYLASTMQANTEPLLRDHNTGKVKGFADAAKLKQAFPEPKIGRGLLEALSKKMAADSQTEADVQKLADTLPESFRIKLATYFRRSSELLRHFFALRSVFSDDSDDNGGIGVSESQRKRLTSIVKGMEKVHGEMYELTRNLDLVESKMFKPIMDQLDWAFKLHREDSAKGGRGGFVPVAKGGFVPVA